MKKMSHKLYSRVVSAALAFVIAVSGLSTVVPILFAQSASADSNVTVTPSSHSPWTAEDMRGGGTTTYVADSNAPIGNGALSLKTTNSSVDKAQYTQYFSPVSLSSVNKLSYSTKQNSAPFAGADASYQLYVYVNGNSGGFDTFTYEPYVNFNNAAIHQGVWQTWNVAAGKFYSSHDFTGVGGGVVTSQGDHIYSLSDLTSYFPNAQVIGIGVNVGSNNPSYDVETDAVDFNGTTYNFDVDAPAAPSNLTISHNGGNVASGTTVNGSFISGSTVLNFDPVADTNAYVTEVTTPTETFDAWNSYNNTWLVQNGAPSQGKFSADGDGTYTYKVKTRSAVTGDWSAWSDTVTLNYDTQAPTTQITAPTSTYLHGTVAIGATATDPNLNVTAFGLEDANGNFLNWFVNTNNTPSYTGNWNTMGVSDGTYKLWLQASDTAGNYSQPITKTIVVDNATPVVTTNINNGDLLRGTVNIDLTTTGEANPSIANIRLLNTDGSATGKGLYPGNGTNSNTWSFDTTSVSDGTYKLQFSAKDAAGNSSTALFRTVTIDNTKPTITPLNTVGDTASKTFSKISFGFYDANKVDTFSLNGHVGHVSPAVYSNYDFANLVSYFGLTDGPNVFTLTDLAGNTAEYDFTFDAIAPVVTIDPVTTVFVGNDVVVTGTTDDTSDVVVIVDGDATTAQTVTPVAGVWTATFSGLGIGTHTFDAASIDLAGNTGSATQVSGDVTAIPVLPTLPALSPTDTTTNTPVQTVTITPNNDNAGVLGDQTTTPSDNSGQSSVDTTNSDNSSDQGVKGATDTKNQATIFGLAWYWWLLILAVLAVIIWRIIAAYRARQNQQ